MAGVNLREENREVISELLSRMSISIKLYRDSGRYNGNGILVP